MKIHRPFRQTELACDFSGSLAARRQGQNFDLAIVQLCRLRLQFSARHVGKPVIDYVLFALSPVTSRRMPGVTSFTPPARDPVER
jgi:hypothetical protein